MMVNDRFPVCRRKRIGWLAVSFGVVFVALSIFLNSQSTITSLLGVTRTEAKRLVEKDQGSREKDVPMQRDLENETGKKHATSNDGDGTFYGHGISFQNSTIPKSQSHCMGTNFLENAWAYRSCEFRFLCYSIHSQQFVLFADMSEAPPLSADMHMSTSFAGQEFVAGGQTAMWLSQGRGVWYPNVRPLQEAPSRYYLLDSNTIWIPHMPQKSCNPGHFLWDVMLPIYLLMDIFDHADKQPLLFPYFPGTPPKIFHKMCYTFMSKFFPLLGIHNYTRSFVEQVETMLVLESHTDTKPNWVCGKHSVAGLGMLTDHGYNNHGHSVQDYERPVNVGRGASLRRFRDWSLKKAGMPKHVPEKNARYNITFSLDSSHSRDRRIRFEKQVLAVKAAFQGNSTIPVNIEQVILKEMSLHEQLQLAMQSSIFVTVAGGGAATAFYLPKGATLVMYFPDHRRLDWDLWNHYANLNVHWMPTKTMDTTDDLKALAELIKHDLQRLQDQ